MRFTPIIALHTLFDYCSEGGALRKMETAKLLKTAPHIHTILQNLLDIDVSSHMTLGDVRICNCARCVILILRLIQY